MRGLGRGCRSPEAAGGNDGGPPAQFWDNLWQIGDDPDEGTVGDIFDCAAGRWTFRCTKFDDRVKPSTGAHHLSDRVASLHSRNCRSDAHRARFAIDTRFNSARNSAVVYRWLPCLDFRRSAARDHVSCDSSDLGITGVGAASSRSADWFGRPDTATCRTAHCGALPEVWVRPARKQYPLPGMWPADRTWRESSARGDWIEKSVSIDAPRLASTTDTSRDAPYGSFF